MDQERNWSWWNTSHCWAVIIRVQLWSTRKERMVATDLTSTWHQNHYHFFPNRVLKWFLLNYLNFVHAARLVILYSAKQNQYLMFTIYTNYSATNTWLLCSIIMMGSKCITSWEITILVFELISKWIFNFCSAVRTERQMRKLKSLRLLLEDSNLQGCKWHLREVVFHELGNLQFVTKT